MCKFSVVSSNQQHETSKWPKQPQMVSTPTLQEKLLRLQFLIETKFCLFPYQIKRDRKID